MRKTRIMTAITAFSRGGDSHIGSVRADPACSSHSGEVTRHEQTATRHESNGFIFGLRRIGLRQ